MKHHLITLLLVLILLLTMAGCSSGGAAMAPDAGQIQLQQQLDAMEHKLDALEDSLDAVLRQQAPAQAAAALPEPAAIDTKPAADSRLTQAEAEKIALDHLGFTADQVERMRSTYEIDDGIPQYDVEFLQGDWEYEFEIHAETGKILSFDKDHKYN